MTNYYKKKTSGNKKKKNRFIKGRRLFIIIFKELNIDLTKKFGDILNW